MRDDKWKAELLLCQAEPEIDPLRKSIGLPPVPCQSRVLVVQAARGQATSESPISRLSNCAVNLVGEALATCVSDAQASREQPKQRLVFDYEAIYALDHPGPGLPKCGPVCRGVLKAGVIGLDLF